MLTKTELEEARTCISSLLDKCNKAILKLEKNRSQFTLMQPRIKALNISNRLIENELQKKEL